MTRHAALAYLLGLEVICLALGAVWLVNNYLDDAPRAAAHAVAVIAEMEEESLAETALEMYDPRQRREQEFIAVSREAALREFAREEEAVLILATPLTEAEIAALDLPADRLPLHQESMDDPSTPAEADPVFVYDNRASREEDRIVAFLHDGRGQREVFRRAQQGPRKLRGRNG